MQRATVAAENDIRKMSVNRLRNRGAQKSRRTLLVLMLLRTWTRGSQFI